MNKGTVIRLLAPLTLGLALAGCVADVMLRNPQTTRTVICKGGYCPGVLCLPAHDRQMRCIDDYQLQGFERVPE